MTQHPTDVLDDARLETLVEEIGDRDVVRGAAQAFLDQLPARLSAIRSAVRAVDLAEVRATAHALGSPATMLGVTGVASAARRLQDAVRDEEQPDVHVLLAQLEEAAADGDAALRDYLSAPLPA